MGAYATRAICSLNDSIKLSEPNDFISIFVAISENQATNLKNSLKLCYLLIFTPASTI